MALTGKHQRWILDAVGPDGWGSMTEADLVEEGARARINGQRIRVALAALVSRGLLEHVSRAGRSALYRVPG